MDPETIVLAIMEIVKLINFYNANLSPAEAKIQTDRWAHVLDFLFAWVDKLPKPVVPASGV